MDKRDKDRASVFKKIYMDVMSAENNGQSFNAMESSARALERELDDCFISFEECLKSTRKNLASSNEENVYTQQKAIMNELVGKIENLLGNLTKNIDKMSLLAASSQHNSEVSSESAVQQFAVSKHKQIFDDHYANLRKLKLKLNSTVSRFKLLHQGYNNYSNEQPTTATEVDYYMQEREHLMSSEKQMDTTINMAVETGQSLIHQRTHFQNMKGRINAFSYRLPMIRNLMNKIDNLKRREAIILGVIIVICFIILWYLVTK